MLFRRFLVRRIGLLPVQVLVTITLVFFVIHSLPGSPVFHRLGLLQTPELAEKLTEQLGLDRPIHTQYWQFLQDLAQGNLGDSILTRRGVADDIVDLFPATLELVLAALIFGLVLGGAIGIASGLRTRRKLARVASTYRFVAGSIPEFWLGLVLIYVFFVLAGVAPGPIGQLSIQLEAPGKITGMVVVDSLLQGDWSALKSSAGHLALPAVTLGVSIGGAVARLTRAMVAEAMESDFVQYARLCGLPRRVVISYTLKTALPPLITLTAVLLITLIGGAVPVEVVFSWGGLGQYAVQAVQVSDYPAIQGVVLAATTFALLVYLAADVLHALVDPRTLTPRKQRSGWWRREGRSGLLSLRVTR